VTRTVQELMQLNGKVALVTGGAGWLGTAMCEALAESGAQVIVASRNLESCQKLAERLPDNAMAVPLDVNQEDAIRTCIDQVVSETGKIDVLVNNAYSGPSTGLKEATGEDFQQSLQTGLTAYFVAAQQAAKHMREQGSHGSIINIASMYGMVASYPEVYVGTGVNSPPAYHAVKGGVIHLTRHLAAYWAEDHIRVNAISPGAFPPPRVSEKGATFIERLETKIPLGRCGEPYEVKGATVFLASEASSYMTGHNLVIDGGWTAW